MILIPLTKERLTISSKKELSMLKKETECGQSPRKETNHAPYHSNILTWNSCSIWNGGCCLWSCISVLQAGRRRTTVSSITTIKDITMNNTLSLRDQMALQILNGLLSAQRGVPYVTLVRESYEIADMMIEQSKKNPQKEIL